MFKPSSYGIRPEPNHRCPDCGHTFLNRPGDQGGDSQCYYCGNHEADYGENADLADPFDYTMREDW